MADRTLDALLLALRVVVAPLLRLRARGGRRRRRRLGQRRRPAASPARGRPTSRTATAPRRRRRRRRCGGARATGSRRAPTTRPTRPAPAPARARERAPRVARARARREARARAPSPRPRNPSRRGRDRRCTLGAAGSPARAAPAWASTAPHRGASQATEEASANCASSRGALELKVNEHTIGARGEAHGDDGRLRRVIRFGTARSRRCGVRAGRSKPVRRPMARTDAGTLQDSEQNSAGGRLHEIADGVRPNPGRC